MIRLALQNSEAGAVHECGLQCRNDIPTSSPDRSTKHTSLHTPAYTIRLTHATTVVTQISGDLWEISALHAKLQYQCTHVDIE